MNAINNMVALETLLHACTITHTPLRVIHSGLSLPSSVHELLHASMVSESLSSNLQAYL
jgi:hypothetical protein